MANRTRRPVAERFWEKVSIDPGGCWLWTGAFDQCGYGRFVASAVPKQVMVKAHRWSWEQAYEPIPPGRNICHACDNPPCVRPDHLFLGTQADNVADMMAKGRRRGSAKPTACPFGHAYDERNTYVDERSVQHCRSCGRLRAKAKRDAIGIPIPPEVLSSTRRLPMHRRWHVGRGLTKVGCEFCEASAG